MTIKVSDLAKELEVSVDEILDQMRRLFVDAEDESSKVDEKIAALIRHKFGGAKPKKPAKKPAAPKAAAKPKKTSKKEAVKSGESAKTDISSEKKLTVDETPEKNLEKIKEAKDILEGVKTEEIKLPEPVDIPKPSDSPKVQGIRIIRHAEPEALKSEPKIKEDMPKPKLLKPKGKKGGFNNERFSPIEVLEIKDDVEGEDGLMGKPGVKRPGAYRKAGKKTSFYKPKSHVDAASVTEDKLPASKTPQKVEMEVPVSVRFLSMKINKKPNEVLRYVIGKGQLITINQDIEEDLARDILTNFGYELEIPKSISTMEKELSEEHHEADKVPLVPRAPIVTFMGHVDHGKTSLLDYIRNTLVAKKEKGGITQHIGAYKVETSKGSVTFLDTPGHEAFTAMRARGANATDVVVLVVAADDGVMPQTKEAIDHARAAGVPIVVAINKCDLANASPDRVKRELQQEDLAPEDWGGKTVMVPVSAKTGEGMDQLVEMLMLESELLDLKANPSIRARGVVIESKKTSGQGVVATFLVKNGTLHVNDIVLVGQYYGKVKAMINEHGDRVLAAPPSTPVEILGLQGVPEAGEEFFVVKDEKKAKTLSTLKQKETRKTRMVSSQRVTLEDLHNRILQGEAKELRIVLKADVQGSVEALRHSLLDLSTSEVKVDIVHYGAGDINESDIMLAMVSNGIVLGFHVKIDPKAEELARNEKIDVHRYDIIYELIDIIRAAMEGMLEPEEKEVFHSRLQVREIFPAKTGKVAGCVVLKGTTSRKDRVRIKRGDEIVHEGEINNLRRFKDDVKDVKEGMECGLNLRSFNDIRKNDIIETFIVEKVARRLNK